MKGKKRATQLVEAAVWLEATGDVDGARKLYQQALKLDPGNSRAKKALELDKARRTKASQGGAKGQVAKAGPTPPPLKTPAPAPAKAPEPREPKRTLLQYPSAHDTLPPADREDLLPLISPHDTLPPVPGHELLPAIDPDEPEDMATVVDTSLHGQQQPPPPPQARPPPLPPPVPEEPPGAGHPTLLESHPLEEEPNQTMVQYPEQLAAPPPLPPPEPAPAPRAVPPGLVPRVPTSPSARAVPPPLPPRPPPAPRDVPIREDLEPEPKTVPRQYLSVNWDAHQPPPVQTATPPLLWMPNLDAKITLELPPAPSPEPLTPPPRPPPAIFQRPEPEPELEPEPSAPESVPTPLLVPLVDPVPEAVLAPTPVLISRPPEVETLPPTPVPSPRNAWETDSTPGVDLGTTLISPRSGMRDAIDLLGEPPPRATPPPVKRPQNLRQEVESLIKGARDLLELDDHTGAMDLIEKAAELAPDDPMVQKLKENSEVVLQSMYESKLGRLNARPKLLLRPDEIIWLNLDHRAGFVLAQIDGSVTYEDLLAICGMSRLDTLRILSQLVGAGVIAGVQG